MQRVGLARQVCASAMMVFVNAVSRAAGTPRVTVRYAASIFAKHSVMRVERCPLVLCTADIWRTRSARCCSSTQSPRCLPRLCRARACTWETLLEADGFRAQQGSSSWDEHRNLCNLQTRHSKCPKVYFGSLDDPINQSINQFFVLGATGGQQTVQPYSEYSN